MPKLDIPPEGPELTWHTMRDWLYKLWLNVKGLTFGADSSTYSNAILATVGQSDFGSFVYVNANNSMVYVDSIAALRALPSFLYPRVYVFGYYAAGDGGGGMYYYDPTDTTSVDDGGAIIVAANGSRWKLVLIDVISVRQYGAKGDNSTDDSSAFQKCLNFATGTLKTSTQTGVKMRIPGGRYVIGAQLTATFRKTNSIIDDGDFRRLTIEGDGQANTYLIYTGPTTGYAFDIEGYVNGTNSGGSQLYLRMSGFRFWQTLSNPKVGGGVQLNNVAYVDWADLSIGYFNINVNAQDTLDFSAVTSVIIGGNGGFLAAKNTFSNPNVFKFTRCHFTGNLVYGVQGTNPANWSFDTCNFETNGNDQINSNTINIIGGPAESGSGINVFNSYFEGNQVAADINIGFNSANSGTVSIKNNGFNRVDATKYAKTHINLSCTSTGVMVANVGGNGFKSFNTYVPSSSNPVMILQTSGITLSEVEPNYYQNSVEAPNYNGFPSLGAAADKDLMMAFIGAGVSPTVAVGWNAASVTRQAVGVYRVNYKVPTTSTSIIPVVTLVGGVGFAYVSGYTTNYVEVSTFTTGLAAADINFTLNVKGLG